MTDRSISPLAVSIAGIVIAVALFIYMLPCPLAVAIELFIRRLQ